MDFNFLKDTKLQVVETKKTSSRTTASKNPTNGADLRIYKNGKIYPSADFVAKNNLEYKEKVSIDGNAEMIEGNGLDIFSSLNWGMIQGTLPKEACFVAVVAKTESKVDLFADTKYDDEGKPKASVMNQGGGSFGKTTLIPMLTEVYGVDFEENDFIDLKVMTDIVMSCDTNRYAIPKTVSRGKNKGQSTYEVRTNIVINPLILLEDFPGESESDGEVADAQTEAYVPTPAEDMNQPNDVAEIEVEAEVVEAEEPKAFETTDEIDIDAEFDAPASNPFLDGTVPGVDPVTPQASEVEDNDWAAQLGNTDNLL